MSKASLIYRSVLLAIGVFGAVLNFGVLSGKLDLNQLNYFTIISNIMVDAYLAGAIVHSVRGGQNAVFSSNVWAPSFKYASMVAITVTCLVAHFLLGGGIWYDEAGNFLIQTPILHYVVPIGFVLDWVLFDKKGSMRIKHVAAGLLMPVAYLAYVMIRVNALNSSFDLVKGSRYPYAFIDLDVLPFEQVAITVVALVVIFVIIGLVYFGIDRLLGKRRNICA